jgi:putative RecB family exonuclease
MWISYSKYSSFKQCPRKYYYQYIEKRPTAPAPALFFGGLIHTCLEFLHRPDGEEPGHRTLKDLLDFLDQNWTPPAEFNEDMLAAAGCGRDRAELLLTEYFLKHVGIEPGRTLEPERALAVEKKFKIDFDGDIVNGIIDRVDKIDGGYEIIDYKTNKKPPSRLFEEHLDQLAIYKWAAEKGAEWVGKFDSGAPLNFTPVAKVGLFFVVPEVNDKILAGDELNVGAVKKKLRTAIDGIKERTEKFEAGDESAFLGTVNRLCDWCDFQQICPLFAAK